MKVKEIDNNINNIICNNTCVYTYTCNNACGKFTNNKERRNLFCLGKVREDSIEQKMVQ